ncbi:MAG: tetratricopeptide (TPR) repeat protein, partial [Planctomycetota bacterium]
GDCIVCLERFLSVAPSQSWRTQVLAHSYYSIGRYEAARTHYERVLEVIATSTEAVRGLALTHYRMGDSSRALTLLDRVIEMKPEHAEALIWKAQILYEEERSEAAFEVAKSARLLEPYNPRPQYMLWQINLDLGRDVEADQAHAKWKELDRFAQEMRSLEGQLLFRPRDYGLATRLANLQEQIGNVVATRKALERAVRNRPDEISEVELRKHALDVLVGMGDEVGAAQAAEALGRFCSEDPEAWKRLETYYARIGNSSMAEKAGELFSRFSREQ